MMFKVAAITAYLALRKTNRAHECRPARISLVITNKMRKNLKQTKANKRFAALVNSVCCAVLTAPYPGFVCGAPLTHTFLLCTLPRIALRVFDARCSPTPIVG